MPTYEYRCSQCEHELEEFQSIMAKPLRKCPACGKNTLKRLIGTGAGVMFKGSGFWQTDYARSGEYKKAAEADKPASASGSGDKKNESGGESKSTGGESKSSESKPAETKAAEPKPAKTESKPARSSRRAGGQGSKREPA